jgi:hypothetical protein
MAGIGVVLFAATLAVLFWVRQRFIDDSDVREDQSARRAGLEHEVEKAMGRPQATAALDLLEIAEFAGMINSTKSDCPKSGAGNP